jgi:threonine dehydrogenase-like Zn-dependent dehydrogenase
LGHHNARTDLGREFGATDIISARREEGIAEVRELIGGHGMHVVLEAVGTMPADEQAVGGKNERSRTTGLRVSCGV